MVQMRRSSVWWFHRTKLCSRSAFPRSGQARLSPPNRPENRLNKPTVVVDVVVLTGFKSLALSMFLVNDEKDESDVVGSNDESNEYELFTACPSNLLTNMKLTSSVVPVNEES